MAGVEASDLKRNVLGLADEHRYEKTHSHQVCFLALQLFDILSPIHRMGVKEKGFLETAALLHDIGWIKGRQKHHKVAMEIIIASEKLLLAPEDKIMIGLTARYHRRALPKSTHKYFSALSPSDKSTVEKMSALLRFADGLDRSRTGYISGLDGKITPKRFILLLQGERIPPEDIIAAKKKADLFEKVFGRKVFIRTTAPAQLPPALPHHLPV